MVKEFLVIIIGYLIGSVPFSFLIAKILKGVDLRKEGTKNVGAINVAKLVGKKAGFSALILDLSKGILAIIFARSLNLSNLWLGLSGLSAIIGHNWPVWLKFKGGKGVATGMGVIAGLFPKETPVFIFMLIIGFFIFRSQLLSLAVVSLFVPIVSLLLNKPKGLVLVSLAIVLFIHIRNIQETKTLFKEKFKF